jgi:hypothetical protein
MSGLFTAFVLLIFVGAFILRDELAARKRRQALLKADPLGQRLKEPAYLRKVYPSR